MDDQQLRVPSPIDGHGVYDLRSVERFLLEACEQRGRVMEEIATVRRRVADADAELARSSETELRLARMVVDAQRVVREERRANERAVAAIRAEGETRAEQIMVAAREQVAAMRASLRGMDRAAPPEPHPPERHPPADFGAQGTR